MRVELVHWPSDEHRRIELSEVSQPRVLLVAHDEPPPVADDPLEDWIRLPADERDLIARVEALSRRAADVLTLDADGIVRNGFRWVALPPTEARLMELLLARLDKVVSREALLEKGWAGLAPRRNVLDVHMLHLRRRVEPLGLTIKTIRKRGYVLSR